MKDPIRVTTATRAWRDFRRVLSRNEWAVWLLGLSRSDSNPTEHGLILIQIDGLSQNQFRRAVNDNRMPFLKSLIEKELYREHTLYSGLPSSTPSVQGELYYGQRTAVPAFGFRDHRTGRLVRMFENDIAQDVETKLSNDNPGLLEGGSSYCNIYSGGAENVHFCSTSFGWSEFFRTIKPLKLMLVMLLNIWIFGRVSALMIIEFFLATIDFFRGIASGRQFWQELIMIPARVVVVVLLRELVTVGVSYDSARGVPVIHVNYLGYDEQAHRRGPTSRFAHWTLLGIDRAIRRIWKSAHRGAGREYDVWVFSDHGQEPTRPYQLVHGKLIQENVAEVVDELVDGSCTAISIPTTRKKVDRLPTRANWLGIGWLVSMLFGEQDHDIQSRSPNVQTVTSGPVGFVYLLNSDAQRHADDIAIQLVRDSKVPMTVQAMGNHEAKVTTDAGTFFLPQDAIHVFGSDHPFLDEVADDLIRLVHHPDSGDIHLIGWNPKHESTSFVLQNGAHAGPGIEETSAMALLPPDVPLSVTGKSYLRPSDLRLAALRFLGRDPEKRFRQVDAIPQDQYIRLMTYNVHACVGMDGQLSPERVARVISQSGAGIVCLQELDVFRSRSGNRDQAHAIARQMEMNFEFHPAWHLEEEKFGNAILTKFPMRVVKAQSLHHHKADRSRRSALWVEVDIDEQTTIQVISTHMSIYPREQLIQARQLLEQWIQPAAILGPVILCGDFNARPYSATWKVFASELSDVESFDGRPSNPTYFSPFPVSRVDHIFVTRDLAAKQVEVVNTRIAEMASDHLPLLANLKLKSNGADTERAS